MPMPLPVMEAELSTTEAAAFVPCTRTPMVEPWMTVLPVTVACTIEPLIERESSCTYTPASEAPRIVTPLMVALVELPWLL